MMQTKVRSARVALHQDTFPLVSLPCSGLPWAWLCIRRQLYDTTVYRTDGQPAGSFLSWKRYSVTLVWKGWWYLAETAGKVSDGEFTSGSRLSVGYCVKHNPGIMRYSR